MEHYGFVWRRGHRSDLRVIRDASPHNLARLWCHMAENIEDKAQSEKPSALVDKISGLGQKIIGEIETIGGILTADPITEAEGEFNLEVGSVREEIEDSIEKENKENK